MGERGPGAALLAHKLEQWHELMGRPATDGAALAENLTEFYQSVIRTDFAALDPAEVTAIAETATEDLFDLGLRLRERVSEWQARGLMTPEAVTGVRNAIRILRYTTDIIGEVAQHYPRLQAGETTTKAFTGPPEWTRIHPAREYDKRFEFRDGDVLLVRGQLTNSAAIARIGDVDSQFSHVGIVHITERGRRWVVEALIEEGASLTPLDAALSHGLGRAVLFRHRNADLARRAARTMFDRVRASRRMFGRWIPYDFTMDPATPSGMFCSKLIAIAYAQASGGALKLPAHPTSLGLKNRDFLERLGVTARTTFAPADLEIEPAFDVVAEWRDYRITPAIRTQDLLMSKLFDWMDEHGYKFRDTLGSRLIGLLGRTSGLLPDVFKDYLLVPLGVPKVPRNMPAKTVATIFMLNATAEPILQTLLALERQRIADTGRPMHPVEVLEWLERHRDASAGRIGYLAAPS
jgi:hypothetical protein